MPSYPLKRIFGALPLLLGISFVSFLLVNIIPVDPAEVILRVNEIVPTEEAVAQIREELGLDKSFLSRYAMWLGKVARLDFGDTFTNGNRTVLGEIKRSLPPTLALAGASLFLILAVSLPLGFLCAVWKDSRFDKTVRFCVFWGTALPNYWAALLLIWFFSLKLDLLPTSGSGGFRHLVLPATALSLGYISTYVRLLRNSMIETLKEDHVLYARARGLAGRRIWLRHVLHNSLHSCVTALGMSIPHLLAGTVVLENIFAWPGIGRLCVTAIFNRDYPVIQAYILMMGALFVFCNLAADLLLHAMDPRLRRGV